MALTKTQRLLLLDKYSGHCAYCGKEIALKEMQADHIEPIFRGWMDGEVVKGEDSIKNMNPLVALVIAGKRLLLLSNSG
jgi:5-methylcytosine-specific restriction endonuclease McrA